MAKKSTRRSTGAGTKSRAGKASRTGQSARDRSLTGNSKKNAKASKPPGNVAAFAEAAECLKAMAHPVRLRMVQLLLHGRYTVGELAEDCEIPDNVASEHLRLLQRCGFLTSERDGRRVYYQVAETHLEQLMACIEGRFLSGSHGPPSSR